VQATPRSVARRDRPPVACRHATLSRLPSEYFRANVSVTFQDDWVAFQTTHLVNHERLLWASDHPNADSTFPNSQRVLAEQTAHLSDRVRDDIVWRNCARLYGLDIADVR
jgi:uncharacterized protein